MLQLRSAHALRSFAQLRCVITRSAPLSTMRKVGDSKVAEHNPMQSVSKPVLSRQEVMRAAESEADGMHAKNKYISQRLGRYDWGSYSELLIQSRAKGDAELREQLYFLTHAFKEFDQNGDGVLSKDDMGLALASLELPAEQSADLFALLDANQDNAIQLDEWIDRLPDEMVDLLAKHPSATKWQGTPSAAEWQGPSKRSKWLTFFSMAHRAEAEEDSESETVSPAPSRQSKDHSLKSEEKLPTIPASPHIRLGDEWDDLTGWGSYAEVMIATRALGDPQETKKLRRLAIAFRDFDRDGDNLLSKAEMLEALNTIKVPGEEVERICDALFQSIDSNEDQVMTLDEWLDRVPLRIIDHLEAHALYEQRWKNQIDQNVGTNFKTKRL